MSHSRHIYFISICNRGRTNNTIHNNRNPSPTTQLNSINMTTILNPAAIPAQFVHMTAGEYRTSRGDDQPVKSNWDLFLHPTHTKASNTRPLKGGTPRIQKDHHRHLFLAALPSFTQDSHAITTISMQSSILQQSPCNSWTKPPGNIELGEHWEGIIMGRLLINPKSKHSFKEWTETREWK